MNQRPLHLVIKQEAMTSAYRLYNLGLFNTVSTKGHSSILQILHKVVPLSLAPSDLFIKTTSILKSFKISLLLRHEWDGVWPFTRPPDCITFYLNHIKSDQFVGVGICCDDLNLENSISLGYLATEFQAVIFGIMSCLSICLEQNFENRTVYICTANKAVLQTLKNFVVKTRLVHDCLCLLNLLGQTNTVQLFWTPAHCGIHEFDHANVLAKLASLQAPIGAEPLLPLSGQIIKDEIYDFILKQHCDYWNSQTSCTNSRLLIKKPLTEDHNWIVNLSRLQQRKLLGAITGHCTLKDHLFNIGLSSDRLCRFCLNDVESTYHIICLCSHFEGHRRHIFRKDYINIDEYAELKVKDIKDFFNACKLDI